MKISIVLLSTFLAIFLISFASAGLTDDLEGYWKLDGTTGVVLDSFLGNHNGTNAGSIRGQGGIINNSFNFTSPSNVTIDSGDINSSNFTEMSISMWINPDIIANAFLYGRDGIQTQDIQLRTGGDLTVNIVDDGAGDNIINHAAGINVSEWTFIVVTIKNSGTVKLYQAGLEVNSTSIGTMGLYPSPILMGIKSNGASAYDGRMDEIGIWNRSLSAGEVLQLYNGGAGLSFDLFAQDILVTLNSPTDNSIVLDGDVDFNVTLTPTNLNLTNATITIWEKDGTFVSSETNVVLGNISNETMFSVTGLVLGDYKWNVFGTGINISGDSIFNFASSNFTFTHGASVINFTLNTTATQTSNQLFAQAIQISEDAIISSVKFIWNAITFSAGFTQIAGNNYTLSKSIDIRNVTGNVDVQWNVTYTSGFEQIINVTEQNIVLLNMSLCGSPHTTSFINFTFTNETVAQESVTGSVSASIFQYFLGTGTINKSILFSSVAEQSSYAFCVTPANLTLNTNLNFKYLNSISSQRTFAPGLIELTDTVRNQELFLLPTTEGIFVTFQVVGAAEQGIEGALVVLERSGFGDITTATTGATGTATIFLNPNSVYTLTVSKAGFTTFQATQQFTESSFTISLGGTVSPLPNDFFKGISYSTTPKDATLNNNTIQQFNFTLASSFWTVSQFGFNLKNSSGTILNSTSANSNGGTVIATIDIANNTAITLDAFWVITGNTTNVTRNWIVLTTGDTRFSIKNFITDIKNFINVGLFGLDSFGLKIIVFIVIFSIVGVMTLNFGLNSPGALVLLTVGLVALADVGLGLIPNPVNAVPGFVTIFTSIIGIAILFFRGTR